MDFHFLTKKKRIFVLQEGPTETHHHGGITPILWPLEKPPLPLVFAPRSLLPLPILLERSGIRTSGYDERPPRVAVHEASPSPPDPEPGNPSPPRQNPSPAPAPPLTRCPRFTAAAARRSAGGGFGRGRASGPALGAGGRPAEYQPRAAASADRGGDVGGGAVAGGLPGGSARRGAILLVPQHPMGPPALLRPTRPLRPLSRPLPRGHAAGVRPQARSQSARRVHGHRHPHHDPSTSATHVRD